MGWVKFGTVGAVILIGWLVGDDRLTYTEIWMLSMLTSLYIDRMAERSTGRYKDAC